MELRERALPRPQSPAPPPDAGTLLAAAGAVVGSIVAGHLAAMSAGSAVGAGLASSWSLLERSVLAVPLLQDPSTAVRGSTWTMLAAVGLVATAWAGVLVIVALAASRVPRAGVIPGTAILAAVALVAVGGGMRLLHVVANVDLHPTLGHTMLHLLGTPVLPLVAVLLLRSTRALRRRPLPHVPLA